MIRLALALHLLAFPVHSWYDQECCQDRDCAPVADDAILPEPGGWRIQATHEFIKIGDPKIKVSLDGRFHRCYNASGTLCIYIPPMA